MDLQRTNDGDGDGDKADEVSLIFVFFLPIEYIQNLLIFFIETYFCLDSNSRD